MTTSFLIAGSCFPQSMESIPACPRIHGFKRAPELEEAEALVLYSPSKIWKSKLEPFFLMKISWNILSADGLLLRFCGGVVVDREILLLLLLTDGYNCCISFHFSRRMRSQ